MLGKKLLTELLCSCLGRVDCFNLPPRVLKSVSPYETDKLQEQIHFLQDTFHRSAGSTRTIFRTELNLAYFGALTCKHGTLACSGTNRQEFRDSYEDIVDRKVNKSSQIHTTTVSCELKKDFTRRLGMSIGVPRLAFGTRAGRWRRRRCHEANPINNS